MKNSDMKSRAMAAYFRTAREDWRGFVVHPSDTLSGVETVNGKEYVVLRNQTKLICAYRIRNQGTLKRLRAPERMFS